MLPLVAWRIAAFARVNADEPSAFRNPQNAQLTFAPRNLGLGQAKERCSIRPAALNVMNTRGAAHDRTITLKRIDNLGKTHEGPKQLADPSTCE